MELVNITYSGEGRQPVELTPLDQQLVTSNFINSNLGADGDYIELFIYDQQNTLIDVDYDAFDYYPFLLNNPQNNTYSALTLEPEKDLRNRGYNRGNLTIQYNFYKKLFNSLDQRNISDKKRNKISISSIIRRSYKRWFYTIPILHCNEELLSNILFELW